MISVLVQHNDYDQWIFIEVSNYTDINICIYSVFLKKKSEGRRLFLSWSLKFSAVVSGPFLLFIHLLGNTEQSRVGERRAQLA
jgi:hypothetical protein